MAGELPAMLTGEHVLFPALTVPVTLAAGREASAVEAAARTAARLLTLVAQPTTEEAPASSRPYRLGGDAHGSVGVVGRVLRMTHAGGMVHALVLGLTRVRVERFVDGEPYPTASIIPLEESEGSEAGRLRGEALEAFRVLVSLRPSLTSQLLDAEQRALRPGHLADFIAANVPFKPAERQRLLETLDVVTRLREVLQLLHRETERRRIEVTIEENIREHAERRQREFLLREQLEAIQRALGEVGRDDLADLRGRLDEAELSEEGRRVVERERARLQRISPLSPEYSTVRTYLEWIADLPWKRSSPDHLDLARAAAVLDEDHYGLQKVKERILEYLAVRKLRNDARGPILCFIGPPGVGKTSLGQSIARALGREFSRSSLGGLRDEASIRGFRRTYVGALPGRIIQELRRVGTNNPVIMLDEVDKLGSDGRGDPSSALLEVLDPAQNSSFVDHYLEIPVDLSTVFFICTANQPDAIPAPLLDRMETIEIPSYTDEEKLQIARRYLLPRRLREVGLGEQSVHLDDEALRTIMSGYTREAGVRGLERAIAAVARSIALRIARGDARGVMVTPERVREILGPAPFRDDIVGEDDEVGVATGLAVTGAGGDVLSVEAAVMPGTGELILTGHLGDVMRESATAAVTYARSQAASLLIPAEFFDRHDVHVHVPAGATPKDGPSAGVTIAVAVVSAVTRRPVRRRIAMTGEITLRGRVLLVGGLREKTLAAYRLGIREIVAPQANEPDWVEVPERVRADMTVHWVERVDEVLALALDLSRAGEDRPALPPRIPGH